LCAHTHSPGLLEHNNSNCDIVNVSVAKFEPASSCFGNHLPRCFACVPLRKCDTAPMRPLTFLHAYSNTRAHNLFHRHKHKHASIFTPYSNTFSLSLSLSLSLARSLARALALSRSRALSHAHASISIHEQVHKLHSHTDTSTPLALEKRAQCPRLLRWKERPRPHLSP